MRSLENLVFQAEIYHVSQVVEKEMSYYRLKLCKHHRCAN